MAAGYRCTITGRSKCSDSAVSSGPPKSPPHSKGRPFSCRILTASSYEMRGKRSLHALELRHVAFEDLQLAAPLVEHAADDGHEEPLGQLHHVVEVGVGHLRLDHPELGEVTARLRLLGAERRAEAVHAAERHRVGFVVQAGRSA